MTQPIRVAISDAGGQIGYALIFRIASGGLFGPEQPIALSLLETSEALPILRSDQMELRDCTFPHLAEVQIGDDPRTAFEAADWIILLGGRPRNRQITRRIELLRENGAIFVHQGQAINQVAPNARILVVANPCNTNCLIAKSHAPNVPDEHWFAMNHLDRMRAVALIADKAMVPVTQVSRVTVWGNHSELVFPDFHNAFIGDRPAPEVITDRAWARDVLEPAVAQRSTEIIKLRGATPAGSAAQAILATIRSITNPTPVGLRFSASVVSDGSYGIHRGLIYGFPLRTENGHSWSIVQGLYHDSYAQSRLSANVAELEHEASIVVDMLGNRAFDR